MEKLDFDPCMLALKNTSEIYHSATLKKDAFMCRLTSDLTKSFEKKKTFVMENLLVTVSARLAVCRKAANL